MYIFIDDYGHLVKRCHDYEREANDITKLQRKRNYEEAEEENVEKKSKLVLEPASPPHFTDSDNEDDDTEIELFKKKKSTEQQKRKTKQQKRKKQQKNAKTKTDRSQQKKSKGTVVKELVRISAVNLKSIIFIL